MRVSVRMPALGCAATAPMALVSACGSAPDPETSSAAAYTAAACPSRTSPGCRDWTSDPTSAAEP
ncbi:hypothetical protein [Rhodococcus sp. JVH1]|uniref:hypothetical protein n=1 Tax=Rhodococcus sp. JVH1 TaxID=745408 RepID=UPI0012F631FE